MITESILNAFNATVQFILSLLPNIPSFPTAVTDALDTIVQLISDTVGVIAYIYTPLILVFVFTLFVAVIAFDNIYKFVMWVLHKIRG